MNCDKCCGCVPPITTYNPSVADNFPTILQQVEYLKAMLKKYPSQQWFITQEKVTEDTIKLDRTKVSLRGRDIAEGDFILGNKEDGTTLMFQYTGVIIELRNYVVEFVGIYSNQSLAEQALSLAQTNEQDIGVLDGEVAGLNNNKLDKSTNITVRGQVYAKDTDGTQTMFDVTTGLYPLSLVRRNFDGQIFINEATEEKNAVNFGQFTDLMRDRLKTLFGNKSIVGYGNIDLYRHLITFSSETYGNISVVYYSSKNLKVDSLTDLKTLMGEAISYPASGAVGSESFEIVKTIDLANLNVSYGANKTMSLSNFAIQDYITTI